MMIGHKTTQFAPLGDQTRIEIKVWPADLADFDPMHDTWEAEAHKALQGIRSRFGIETRSTPDHPETTVKILRWILDDTFSPANRHDNWAEDELCEQLASMGAYALAHVDKCDDEIVSILADKQAAYGQGNINAFGYTGLHVRMSDKVNRIENLLAKQRGDLDFVEGIEDTWLDLVGYAVITVMLQNGSFEAPLARDLPTAEEQIDELLADVRDMLLDGLAS